MEQQHPGKRPSPRILVVDDDPQTATLLRDWFGGRDYEILDASSGEAALRQVAESLPDLILLDLKMPGMDGISVARRLKEDPSSRSIPIILLTACRNLDTKVEAFAAGADDYVTKPFEVEEIEARVRNSLRKRSMLLRLQADNDQLENLLTLDEKTGLANFREFRRRLEQEWRRAERYPTPLSLVFLDLDHFKHINDTLGHPAGDQVLVEFAKLITVGARANDVAARYGGEEFAVILPHTDAEMGLRVAERIVTAVRDFVFLENQADARITVSAGVATYTPDCGIESVDALVRAADAALYRAKDAGRNCVVQAPENVRRPELNQNET